MTVQGGVPGTLDPAAVQSYDAAVAELFARRPEWIVPGLRRIRALCRALGDPQHAYTPVHITGTNGKTSTARIVTALLLAAGHRVGTYTSPHLQDVRERILIDGAPVGRADFHRALQALQPSFVTVEQELGEMVTFFEALTALGATCLRSAAVDVGVIEVGMGGRWDATNVHDAPVAVIGTVGMDHPELGATIAEVAAEKAGILVDGAVAVVGPQQPEAEQVIAAEAAERGVRLLHVGREVQVCARTPVAGGQDLVVRIGERTFDVHLPLHGAHQATNAACAIAAVDALLGEVGGLPLEVARDGLGRARSPGRLEHVTQPDGPTVVLDGAHNPDGARCLATALAETAEGRRIVAVVGVLGDKDVRGVVNAVCEVADECVVTLSPCGRAASTTELAAAVHAAGRPVSIADEPVAALRSATERAGPEGLVVVTGSLYLVGAVRDLLGKRVG